MLTAEAEECWRVGEVWKQEPRRQRPFVELSSSANLRAHRQFAATEAER